MHTEYVKREIIVIAWLKKKLLLMNVRALHGLELKRSEKNCVCLSVCGWFFYKLNNFFDLIIYIHPEIFFFTSGHKINLHVYQDLFEKKCFFFI